MVNLAIYDLRGELVKILFRGQQDLGNHMFDWDGTNKLGEYMSSGFYFYTLRVGDQVETRKMILVK